VALPRGTVSPMGHWKCTNCSR